MRVVVATMLAFAAIASATDHPQIAARLSLRQSTDRSSLVWVTKLPPLVLPAASPTLAPASLAIQAQSGEGAVFDLPPGGWTADATGSTYKFKNADAPAGLSQVRLVILEDGKALKVFAKSSGLTLDEPSQGSVYVALAIGDDVYCSTCTVPTHDEPGRYAAKACPVPAACVPPTTTVTSTTTSTTNPLPGTCGNGVVDQPSEQCDGADPGICDDYPEFPFPIECRPPGDVAECLCCSPGCFISPFGGSGCCPGEQCQDTTGVGSVRAGACIRTTCAQDGDCGTGHCADGACCSVQGQLCGVLDCCPGSGLVCSSTPDSLLLSCCLPAGATCGTTAACCSRVCDAGTCG